MPFFEDFEPVLYIANLRNKTHHLSDTLSTIISQSMSATSCGATENDVCRDVSAAFSWKMGAIAAILIAGVTGVALPLVGKKRWFLSTNGNIFVGVKAFAAGVILATGFVHMLPDGSSSLTDGCLPTVPWTKFPFAEFIAMLAALGTLAADFAGTQYFERKSEEEQRRRIEEHGTVTERTGGHHGEVSVDFGIVPVEDAKDHTGTGKVFAAVDEGQGGGMHIVGMHAHAAAHRHSHPHSYGGNSCEGGAWKAGHVGHAHTSSAADVCGPSDSGRHVVVAQILELGIVSHSVIIGLSLGVSESPCTIKPLMAALSFHQFFEGFALGGCISQAQFKTSSALLMACFFAITTPAGIGIGTAVSSFYNPNSPMALIVEGILDSVSAGILVYMALVDLIAADFLSKRMSCNFRLQVVSYFALFLGACLMSSLAIWA